MAKQAPNTDKGRDTVRDQMWFDVIWFWRPWLSGSGVFDYVRAEAWIRVSGVIVRYSVLEALEDDQPNSKTQLEAVEMQQV